MHGSQGKSGYFKCRNCQRAFTPVQSCFVQSSPHFCSDAHKAILPQRSIFYNFHDIMTSKCKLAHAFYDTYVSRLVWFWRQQSKDNSKIWVFLQTMAWWLPVAVLEMDLPCHWPLAMLSWIFLPQDTSRGAADISRLAGDNTSSTKWLPGDGM